MKLFRKVSSAILSAILAFNIGISCFGFEVLAAENNNQEVSETIEEKQELSQYTLFSNGMPDEKNEEITNAVSISCNICNIEGDVYSGTGFMGNGASITIDGNVDATEKISVNTSQNNIGGRNENVEKLDMPDLENYIFEQADDIDFDEEEITRIDGQELEEETIKTSGNVEISDTVFEDDCYIIADGNIEYNAENAMGSGRVVLYSRKGNIKVENHGSNIDFNGIIYAPKGSVEINAKEADIKGRIFANNINLSGNDINIKGSEFDWNLIDFEPVAPNWICSEIKGNVKENMETDPRQDFNLYVNKNWVLSHNLTEGQGQLCNFSATDNDIKEEFMRLLKDKSLTSETAKNVQAMYEKILDWDSRNEAGYEPIREEIEKINKINTVNDFFKYITDTTDGYPMTLLNIGVYSDFKNAKQNVVYLEQCDFLLGDAILYSDCNTEEIAKMRSDLISKNIAITTYMLAKLKGDDGLGWNDIPNDVREAMLQGNPELEKINPETYNEANKMVNEAIRFETELAEVSYKGNELSSLDSIINNTELTDVNEISTKCGTYPLSGIWDSLGLKNKTVIKLCQDSYLEKLDKIITEDNLPAIKDLFKIKIFMENYDNLDKETNDFVNKFLGSEMTEDEYAYKKLFKLMPIQCQQLYVENYGLEKNKNKIRVLCEQMISKYKTMLKNCGSWLSDETINKAIEKLDNMKICTLYPDEEYWPNEKVYDDNDSYFDCLQKHNNYVKQYNYSKAGEERKCESWFDIDSDSNINLLMCNAYYMPLFNEIIIPIGVTRGIFYNENMSISQLYSSLGAVIGHEISHAFDLTGCKFDKDGSYIDWWNQEDKAKYNERVEKVINYLNSIEVLDEQYVNGSLVVSEVMADISGIQCVLKMAEEIEDFDYEEFFESYANLWADISTEDFVVKMLIMDPHLPMYLRPNVTFQQFKEFLKTYDIHKGDGMYTRKKDRLLIWV